MKENLVKRFWNFVDIKDKESCWNWIGSKRPNGYGVLYTGKDRPGVHRLSYEIHFGDIPKGKQVLHTCDNPSCVNPYHLYLGTQGDNMCDRYRRNRCPRNTGGQAKLKDGEVWLIRKLYLSGKVTQKLISKMFKVSQSTISLHIRGLSVTKEAQI